MGLFDDLFATKSAATSNNRATSDQTQAQSTTTTGQTSTSGQQSTSSSQKAVAKSSSDNVGATSSQGAQEGGSSNVTQGTAAQTGKTVTSSLDAGSLSLLTGLLPHIISDVGGNADSLSRIGDVLSQVAQTPAVSDADIAGAQSAAKVSFNQGEAVDIGRARQTIGSRDNTYGIQLEQKGQQDLAATLAGIVAQAHLENKNSTIQGLNAAAGAYSADQNKLNPLLALVDALSKGQQTSETSGATTTSQTEAVTNFLNQLAQGLTSSSTVGETSSSTDVNELISNLQDILTNQQSDQVGRASVESTSNTQGSQMSKDGILTSIVSLFK